MDRPFKEVIHSDFLIHWTGKDIDTEYQPEWNSDKASLTDEKPIVTDLYLKRLKDILKYGLWMTSGQEDEPLKVNGQMLPKPAVARTCFTELKLSESRRHAEKFGRLGIGVKRFFLFTRLGQPVFYVNEKSRNLFFTPFFNLFKQGSFEYKLVGFLKNMSSKGYLTYDLFAESEWRIIFSDEIKAKLEENGREDIIKLFKDPRSEKDNFLKEYCDSLVKKKPEYLIPLDGWFSMVIYPSPQVKNEACKNKEIRELIKNVKSTSLIKINPKYERKMMPIELDLDACSHF